MKLPDEVIEAGRRACWNKYFHSWDTPIEAIFMAMARALVEHHKEKPARPEDWAAWNTKMTEAMRGNSPRYKRLMAREVGEE